MKENKQNGGWVDLKEDKTIDLGEYSTIKEPEDWYKGTERAMETILERMEVSPTVENRAEELLEKVDSNQAEFSGKSRVSLAAAIVYQALQGKTEIKDLSEIGSISTASLKNTIEMMDRMDLN